MKFTTEDLTNEPWKIDATTKLTMIFEPGDVFVNEKNEVIMLQNIEGKDFVLVDGTGKKFTDSDFLSEVWKTKHRFVGSCEDDFFPPWEYAVPLI